MFAGGPAACSSEGWFKGEMKSHLRDLLAQAIEKTAKGGELNTTDLPPLLLEPSKQKELGDLATNVALIWAKEQRKSPRAIAEAILKNLAEPNGILARAVRAVPGFLNFSFSSRFCYERLRVVEDGRELEVDLGR